jgi:hypothetical protein
MSDPDTAGQALPALGKGRRGLATGTRVRGRAGRWTVKLTRQKTALSTRGVVNANYGSEAGSQQYTEMLPGIASAG